MPASTTRVRVAKSRKAATAKGLVTRRTAVRAPRKAAKVCKVGNVSNVCNVEGDALLVAQFAHALGERPRQTSRGQRRSLAQALDAIPTLSAGVSALDVMPGARAAPVPPRNVAARDASDPGPPCLTLHRRNRVRRRLVSAGSWCFAVAVTVAIVGTAAAGLLAHAPHARQTIAAASAGQF